MSRSNNVLHKKTLKIKLKIYNENTNTTAEPRKTFHDTRSNAIDLRFVLVVPCLFICFIVFQPPFAAD